MDQEYLKRLQEKIKVKEAKSFEEKYSSYQDDIRNKILGKNVEAQEEEVDEAPVEEPKEEDKMAAVKEGVEELKIRVDASKKERLRSKTAQIIDKMKDLSE